MHFELSTIKKRMAHNWYNCQKDNYMIWGTYLNYMHFPKIFDLTGSAPVLSLILKG